MSVEGRNRKVQAIYEKASEDAKPDIEAVVSLLAPGLKLEKPAAAKGKKTDSSASADLSAADRQDWESVKHHFTRAG